MFETTGEFKKAVKTLVKGAIKSKIFGGEKQNYVFDVQLGEFNKKEKQGGVAVAISEGPFTIAIDDLANTRVYNKVNDEFFAPIAEQFKKLKNVHSVKFVIK